MKVHLEQDRIRMYSYLINLHSYSRWAVVVALVLLLLRSFWAWKRRLPYLSLDSFVQYFLLITIYFQGIMGWWLYTISPMVSAFWQHWPGSIHAREQRFFGMEHGFMMSLSIALITIGSIKARKKETAVGKFKTLFIWFGIAFLCLFFSIPWCFSPLTARPCWR